MQNANLCNAFNTISHVNNHPAGVVLSVAGTARRGYVSSQPIKEASGSLAEPPVAFNHIRIAQ